MLIRLITFTPLKSQTPSSQCRRQTPGKWMCEPAQRQRWGNVGHYPSDRWSSTTQGGGRMKSVRSLQRSSLSGNLPKAKGHKLSMVINLNPERWLKLWRFYTQSDIKIWKQMLWLKWLHWKIHPLVPWKFSIVGRKGLAHQSHKQQSICNNKEYTLFLKRKKVHSQPTRSKAFHFTKCHI